MRTVLHMRAEHNEMSYGILATAFITRGHDLSIHVDRSDGTIDIYNYVQRGTHTSVQMSVATGDCGCP